MSIEDETTAAKVRMRNIEDAIARDNAAMDARADSFLDRLKTSKWTAWILLAVAAVVVTLVIRAI